MISTQPGPVFLLTAKVSENISICKFFLELNSEALQCPVTCLSTFTQHLLGDAPAAPLSALRALLKRVPWSITHETAHSCAN